MTLTLPEQILVLALFVFAAGPARSQSPPSLVGAVGAVGKRQRRAGRMDEVNLGSAPGEKGGVGASQCRSDERLVDLDSSRCLQQSIRLPLETNPLQRTPRFRRRRSRIGRVSGEAYRESGSLPDLERELSMRIAPKTSLSRTSVAKHPA